jgi:hypothetical protein
VFEAALELYGVTNIRDLPEDKKAEFFIVVDSASSDNDLSDIEEDMKVKQAVGIASDKRYKKGNMTGAVNAIEKLKPGLSDNPQVKAVLKRQNENVETDIEQLDEKNVPTSPEKWAQAKSQAKAKFDVYPSAYANGWAAKKYKEMGGSWKSMKEEIELDESFNVIATHGKVEVRSHPGDSEGNHISIHKNGKEVASGDYDFYADSYFISHPSLGKGQKPFNSAKSIAHHFSTMKEEIEQVDELKIGTLVRYASKAGKDALSKGIESGRARDMGDDDKAAALKQKSDKRYAGQGQAIRKINNRFKSGVNVGEEVEEVDEQEKLPTGVEMHYTHSDPKKKPTKSVHFSAQDAMRHQKDMEKQGYKLSHKKAVYAKEDVNEKKLTPAEMKKREEVAKAIERDQPKMAMDKKMAIATATAKKVAESKDDYGSMSKSEFKRREMEHELGDEDRSKRKSSNSKVKGTPLTTSTPPYNRFKKEDVDQIDEVRGGEDEPDKHIIMQLRSAQDLDGKRDIRFRGGKTAKVAKQHIDKILKLHDHPSMKPVNKRVLRVTISKSPQHLAQFADKIKENFTVEQMEPIFEHLLNNPNFELYEAPYKVPSNYTAMMQKKKKQDVTQQMADKAKKDNITQSDKEKLTKMSAMMKKEQATEKEVKMAKGVAFDKRYKGGNYTGAANTIEKIRKGLSDHPSVKSALRRANENTTGSSDKTKV